MKPLLSAFAAGLLFSIGLGISGMTQADKVIGFLNVAGDWDASLGLVMAGAIGVHLVAYRLVPRVHQPFFAPNFRIPTRSDLDGRLIGGAALFGVGWAIGGYCPGPGLVSAASGSVPGLLFLVGMVAGMAVFHGVDEASRIRPSPSASAADKASTG